MRDQSTLMRNLLGGWQVSGATFFRTGTPFAVLRNNDIAGVGDGGFLQPVNLVGDVNAGANKEFSTAVGDGNFWFNPAAFANPAAGTFGNAPRNIIYNPGEQQWDIALFKNFNAGRHPPCAVPGGVLQLPEPPELGRTSRRGCAAGSGLGRPEQRRLRPGDQQRQGERTAQLSLRFLF